MPDPDSDVAHLALALARQAVERYVRTGLLADLPAEPPSAFREASGAFVTLRLRGELRGCIGTLGPTRSDLAREIVASAVAAAVRDPRFPPVTAVELPALVYEVNVVGSVEAIETPGDLDPKTYGVVVEAQGRRGVLLPDLEGVDTVVQQVAIARRKAGLPDEAPITLYRFQVRRYVEAVSAG
ncbi:MAG: AmmeMemoRadiSam system protein A [Candidatus Rokuibacteriota bacterium]